MCSENLPSQLSLYLNDFIHKRTSDPKMQPDRNADTRSASCNLVLRLRWRLRRADHILSSTNLNSSEAGPAVMQCRDQTVMQGRKTAGCQLSVLRLAIAGWIPEIRQDYVDCTQCQCRDLVIPSHSGPAGQRHYTSDTAAPTLEICIAEWLRSSAVQLSRSVLASPTCNPGLQSKILKCSRM